MDYKTIRLPGIKLSFFKWKETLYIFTSIFLKKEYNFKTNSTTPFILDCGAHIGLSVLGFKKQYPYSKIIAFEPNPRTFKLLKLNVEQNNLKNVTLVNAALSDKETSTFLYLGRSKQPKETWGDTLVKNWFQLRGGHKKIKVKTVKLSNYINRPVDFLKIDIEGAETKVLEEIGDKLSFVKNIVFEFHVIPGDKKQTSPNIIYKLLKINDFTFKVEKKIESKNRRYLIIRARKK